jgi:hypothetical protein
MELAGLKGLQSLGLTYTKGTDAGLKQLAEMTNADLRTCKGYRFL